MTMLNVYTARKNCQFSLLINVEFSAQGVICGLRNHVVVLEKETPSYVKIVT